MMTPLRQRMIEDMELRGLSPATRQRYIEAIRGLAKYYHQSPDLLTEEELRAYFVYLTKTKRIASSTLTVQLSAIKFLFDRTLRRPWPVLKLARIKDRRRLPVILSPEEVRRILSLVRRPAARMALTMMYSCGLRASEATHLQVTDIDSQRMVVIVRGGKGNKDRHVPLPHPTLEALRAYWRLKRPPRPWLFPSPGHPTVPVGTAPVRRCLVRVCRDLGLTKKVSCHTLRHSYATHLLEKGVDLRVIQGLLGHRSLRTTFVYLQLTPAILKTVHACVNDLTQGLPGMPAR
jgi:site-specific recombinase XerD